MLETSERDSLSASAQCLPRLRSLPHPALESVSRHDNEASAGNSLQRSEPSSSDRPHQAVQDPVDVEVFAHYIRDAGYWLDIVPPELHMSRTVPMLAMHDDLLTAACLAYSSHTLHLLGKLEKRHEEQYNDAALSKLIPKLSENPATWSSSLLAVTVMLRTSEQFSEIGDDQQYHLNGAFSESGAAGRRWTANARDLNSIAFWTYLRMTIRVCFLQESGPNCDLTMIDERANLQGDAAWANSMTCIMAKLCKVCWGQKSSLDTLARLTQLSFELQEWKRTLPHTFEPWAQIQQADDPFPTLKYLHTWHAIAWQFYYATLVLLSVYQPPASVNNVLSQNRRLEQDILKPTRKLCAVTWCSGELGVEINGPHLMAWCGQFLTSKQEQLCLVSWLDDFMERTKWPNWTCSQRLRRIWAGERSNWTGREE